MAGLFNEGADDDFLLQQEDDQPEVGPSAGNIDTTNKKLSKEEKEALRLRMKAEAQARKKQAVAGTDTQAMSEEAQSIKRFQQKKKFVLDNLSSMCATDKSPKGFVDGRCKPTMDVLNRHQDYVTTSSCSGRVALFHMDATNCTALGGSTAAGAVDGTPSEMDESGDAGSRKRGSGGQGWLFVSHEPATEDEIDRMVELAVDAAKSPKEGILSYKSEQFVMHIQCRTLDAAKKLLHIAASKAGYRNSGMTVGKHFTTVAIRHASTLDTPLTVLAPEAGSTPVCLCSDSSYLRGLFTFGNQRLRSNFDQMDRLATELKVGLADEGAPAAKE
jgi:tRNA wybutosine-synthesizing protein 3